MGVTIVAVSRLESAPEVSLADLYAGRASWDDHEHAFAYEGFERSTRGLVDHDVLTQVPEGSPIIAQSIYRHTDETRTHHVQSRSYSGYNLFREELAALVGLEPRQVWSDPGSHQDSPFFELINFADNEGVIGPEAAADLLQDFRDHLSKAVAALDERDLADYRSWIEGLELAADRGMVVFG